MTYEEEVLKSYIDFHITDLHQNDCGVINFFEDENIKYVDIEWCDGFTAFNLNKVLNLIKEKGKITKDDLIEYCH